MIEIYDDKITDLLEPHKNLDISVKQFQSCIEIFNACKTPVTDSQMLRTLVQYG